MRNTISSGLLLLSIWANLALGAFQPGQNVCVASADIDFHHVSSIKTEGSLRPNCGDLCKKLYPKPTSFLKFYHSQEKEIQCLCYDDESSPFKKSSDKGLCNILCPGEEQRGNGSSTTCGGLQKSSTSPELEVYYSSFNIEPEAIVSSSTTQRTTTSSSSKAPPGRPKWQTFLQETTMDINDKLVIIIVLQILLLIFIVLVFTWYSLVHGSASFHHQPNKVAPAPKDDSSPTYGSTEKNNVPKTSGNSTFYE